MRYMLMIFANEETMGQMTPEAMSANMSAWWKYTNDMQEAGKYVVGDALQPTATATTVRSDAVIDGPYAETKEQLGGYYIVEAADLDEAINWAKRMPHMAQGGATEVRPVLDLGGTTEYRPE